MIALLSALLLILVFPSFNLTLVAPFALIPLVFVLSREPRARRRISIAYATGVVYWFGVCYWIQFTLSVHGGTGDLLGWALFLLFCLAKAIQMGVFGWLVRPNLPVPAIAALWTLLEWTHQYTGFTWLQLGNAAIDWPILPRVAPWTGVYGISFLLALTAASIARRQWAWLALLAIPFVLPSLPPQEKGPASAWVVQPNIPEEETWSPPAVEALNRRLAELSVPRQPVQFVVWPEAPAPIYDFDVNLPLIAKRAQADFLAGVVSHAPEGAPLNSALLISNEGKFISRYDKVNLVPFGEFVPWPFAALTKKISSEAGDYQAGSRVVVAHRAGVFICYESVFPSYIRQFARDGAEVLFNLSNDGWFGKSAARFQHFQIVRMRAVENRRWIVRVTNNGITASIDPAGRIAQMEMSYREVAAALPFGYSRELTFYTRAGDWFVWLCALGLSFYAVIAFRSGAR